jgi:predicted enzyme related to lactoylglutathione lyase
MPTMEPPRCEVSTISLIAIDIEALARFYSTLLGLPARMDQHSPVFRGLQCGDVMLGFSAPEVTAILGIDDRPAGRGAFATFELPSVDALHASTDGAIRLGAQLLRAPYETYYGSLQAVLADPEGNVFRLNHRLA